MELEGVVMRNGSLAVMTLTMLGVVLAWDGARAGHPAIEERQALMKTLGTATKAGAEMVKGARPYDAAEAKRILDTYVAASSRIAGLFPAGSEEGGYTKAMIEIWSDATGFKAAVDKFEADARAAATATGDLEAFKQAFATVGADCRSCHSDYRQ